MTAKQKAVAAILRKYPDEGHRTLARALHTDNPALFPTLESARSVLRYTTGNNGKTNRPLAAKPRPPRKPGELPPLPESDAKPWLPFEIDAKRSLILGDLHIPFHSLVAVEAALKFGDTFDPEAIFINGDLFDFYQLSKFDKNPSLAKVERELALGKQFLTHVRQRFPKARLYFKLGNHDERWALYLFRLAPMLAIKAVLDAWMEPAGIIENEVTVIGEQRPVMFGKLPVFHGHELGRGITSPVNPARGAFLRAHHTVAVNHHHQTSNHADTNIWHDETTCWSFGCLCDLTPDYARVNRWNWGFAAVTNRSDGSFDVENMRISKGGTVRKS